MGPNEYRCACCGEVYEKGRSDEEAMEECEEIFGDTNDVAIVCDDCWRVMMGLPSAEEFVQ